MDSHTTVAHRTWFSRLMDSCCGVCFGLILCLVAPSVLFWNEGRAIETSKTIREASQAVLPGSQTIYSAENDGSLIAVSGLFAKPMSDDPLIDKEILPSGVSDLINDELISYQNTLGGALLYLHRDVSYYEWTESKSSKTEKTAGGGETTTTTYSYSKSWGTTHHDSSFFNNPMGHENPAALYHDADYHTEDRVILSTSKSASKSSEGKDTNFWLSPLLVSNLVSQSGRGNTVGPTVVWRPSTKEIDPQGYEEIGDHRFSWSAVGPMVMSAMAMQSSGGELTAWKSSSGRSFSYIHAGMLSAADMIDAAYMENTFLTWILRGVGLAIWFFAFSMISKPLTVAADLGTIPCLGFEPGTILEYITGCFAFFLAFILSMVTIAISWMFYAPVWSACIIGLAAGGLFFARKYAKKGQTTKSFDLVEREDFEPKNPC